MPPLLVSQGVLVRLVWSVSGTPSAVNVLGVRNVANAPINQAAADFIANTITNAYSTGPLPGKIHTSVTLSGVGVRNIAIAAQPEVPGVVTPVPGTGTGKLLPPQVALCATLRTALAGKSYRGRYYAFGFNDGALTTAGTADPTVSTALTTFLNAVRTNMASGQFPLAIVSRKLATLENVTTVESRDNLWETIRGRASPGI